MTNFDKEMIIEWGKAFASMVAVFVLLLLACVMCGCTKTQYIPIPEYHTESIRTDSTTFLSLLQTLRNIELMKQRNTDTLRAIDKEVVVLDENGDTAKHLKYIYIYLSKAQEVEYQRTIEILRDSVRELKAEKSIVKVDSVPVPYPVERELSRWEQTKMDLGGFAFGGIVVAIIIIAILAWIARKRKK